MDSDKTTVRNDSIDAKYILTGLRMYGDKLAETVIDKALTAEERRGFMLDLHRVEYLINTFDQNITAAHNRKRQQQ